MPTRITIGLVLAGIGVLFTGISWAWNYFGFRAYGGSFVFYFQIEILLSVVEVLCSQTGLFLIFWGILTLLAGTGLWSRLGPILIFVGALVLAAVGIAEIALEPLAFSVGTASNLTWLFDIILGAEVTAYVVTALGLIVSLFAVAQAVLVRASPPVIP